MNPALDRLPPYPFERLNQLKAGQRPDTTLAHIGMSIGEPQHAPPDFIVSALTQALAGLGSYPSTPGVQELRAAAARWLERRFRLPANGIDPQTMVLPVSGTREGLFSFVQTVIDARTRPLVVMPNPFYQIYEGAAYLAGAEPYFLAAPPASNYVPDLDAVPADVWRRCQLLFLCTPGNPSGAVMSLEYLERVLGIAERYGFIVASDECYADIYLNELAPPPSLLNACFATGRVRAAGCVVFHSLSKRSSVPGLRSGFVAGDPALIRAFRLYRTYHGCAVPLPTQLASIPAWNDDAHAATNRRLYREKFDRVLPILQPVMSVERPEAAFYLWPDIGGDDEIFVRNLYARKNLTTLPGSYLARNNSGSGQDNPGRGRVRISLVAGVSECVEAAGRIRAFVEGR
jgi:N-succinyldiaminopimelate aminotransferase